ncbi:MAG: oligosaccharide flippase family protein [Pseudomonadota bacterium]
MTLGRNLLAGLSNSVWSALVGFATVPFYLKYLGIEAYGLIGFFMTTQALLQLLDMGMAPTINREVARSAAAGELEKAGRLLHTLAVVYWGVAAGIAIVIFLISSVIANYWLQSQQLSPATMSNAVMLMGLVLAARFPIALYQGALIGAQRLVVSSVINMAMVTIGGGGAILILAFVEPTIEAFFCWQAAIGLMYAVVIRAAAWKVVGRSGSREFDWKLLKQVWRFTAGMSAIGLTALVFTQLDKVILSKMLGLGEFAHYMLATVVVSGLYVLVSPLFNVIFPRFSSLVVTGELEKLQELYRLGTRYLSSTLFPIALTLAFFAEDLVYVWTGDGNVASSVAPIIQAMVIGSALNGVMYFPYALQLAHGLTWIPLTINIGLMILLAPLIVYLTRAYGPMGGAIAWMTTQIAYALVGPWLTHKYIFQGLALRWLANDVGLALLATLFAALAGHWLIGTGDFSHFERLFLAAGLALLTATSLLLAPAELRKVLLAYLRKGPAAV